MENLPSVIAACAISYAYRRGALDSVWSIRFKGRIQHPAHLPDRADGCPPAAPGLLHCHGFSGGLKKPGSRGIFCSCMQQMSTDTIVGTSTLLKSSGLSPSDQCRCHAPQLLELFREMEDIAIAQSFRNGTDGKIRFLQQMLGTLGPCPDPELYGTAAELFLEFSRKVGGRQSAFFA